MKIEKKDTNVEKLRNALLLLVRAGLWGQMSEDVSAFCLSDVEWNGVYRLSRQHTVTALAFHGLSLLPEDKFPPQALLIKWAAESDAVERRNIKMNGVIEQLYNIYREKGLSPVLQKGQGIATCYESPLQRECGDIDLYFNNRIAWHIALSSLRKRHIKFARQADKSICFKWQGFDIEYHRHLFDLYNPFLQSVVDRYEIDKGYRYVMLSAESSVCITVPSPFLDVLLQNLHILKHTISRGIGLRQMCDMARTCYKLHGEIDAEEMRMVCNKLGLERWTSLLHAFMVDYLGLPVEYLPYKDKVPTAVPLANIVWRGGNFGQHDPSIAPDANVFRRKLDTLQSFMRNMRFASYYAPKEAFWYFIQLLKGQF
ncbi:nucleotidyltransferase family protein [Prevotella sp.]|uniref:nucleotidyltransferase family protein n=1 Tax=Prevotella sp. TaxID=59823 RepID=UPI003AB38534